MTAGIFEVTNAAEPRSLRLHLHLHLREMLIGKSDRQAQRSQQHLSCLSD